MNLVLVWCLILRDSFIIIIIIITLTFQCFLGLLCNAHFTEILFH